MPILNVLAIANIPRGVALFPNLIASNEGAANSLTIARAASTEKTLWVMLHMACLGLPFVLAYTATIYWVFRGKVLIGKFNY